MNLDTNNVSGSKETLKLLDFAKTVTESIKCALEKTNKPRKKKANHRKYIQRKCFTKSGMKGKQNKRGNKRIKSSETRLSFLHDNESFAVEDSFQAMLESEKLCMSYLYMKDSHDIMEHFNHEDYLSQHESHCQLNGLYNYSSLNPVQAADSSSWNHWQGYYGAQYPPKLKHIDYEQILVNQQRQRAACNQTSYLAAIYDERFLYDYTQSAWQNTYSDSVSYNGFASRETPCGTFLNTDLLQN